MTRLSIAIAKSSMVAAVTGAATFAVPAAAQLAAPQWTRPAMDSTHVTGTAERVMPEIPANRTDNLQTKTKAPTTISELLAAFDGIQLEMQPNEGFNGTAPLRFIFTKDKMQSQYNELWTWHDGCSADANVPRCANGNHNFFLSPEGLSVIRQGCGNSLGSAGGSAEFKWTDFIGFGGSEAPVKRWALQRASFWTSCYVDGGSND